MEIKNKASSFSCYGRSSEKGLTLVELLVVIVISAILGISVMAMFINQTRAMALNEDLVDLEQNLRVAMDMLHRDVRMAGAYLDIENMPTFKLGTITYNSAANVMVALNSEGGTAPDAIQLRYSSEPGLQFVSYNGSSKNFTVCKPSGLTSGQVIEVSYVADDGINPTYPVNGIIVVSSVSTVSCSSVSCPGDCEKPIFAIGKSEWNPTAGLENYLNSGHAWNNIETLTYFIEDNYIEGSISFGPALMRAKGLEPPSIVAFGVNDLQITYLNSSENPTTVLSDIRRVELSLTGETRNEHNIGTAPAKRTRTMTTEVLVRNLTF